MVRKIVFIMLMFFVIFLFGLCILYYFFGFENYALKINGISVSKEEYKAYLYIEEFKNEESTGNDGNIEYENIKQEAVKNCISVYMAVKFAEKRGIKLNNDEKIDAEKIYDQIIENKNAEISEKVLKKVCHDIIIYNKIYKYVTDDFILSEKDFDTLFDSYYSENKRELEKMYISCIFIDSQKHDLLYAEEIYGRVLESNDFESTAESCSDEEYINDVDVEEAFFEESLKEEIFNMSEYEINMLETDKGFYIVRVNKIQTPDVQKLKEDIKQTFIDKRKKEIYEQQNDKWLENYVIEKNSVFIENLRQNSVNTADKSGG